MILLNSVDLSQKLLNESFKMSSSLSQQISIKFDPFPLQIAEVLNGWSHIPEIPQLSIRQTAFLCLFWCFFDTFFYWLTKTNHRKKSQINIKVKFLTPFLKSSGLNHGRGKVHEHILVILADQPGPNGRLSCLHSFKIFWPMKPSYTSNEMT